MGLNRNLGNIPEVIKESGGKIGIGTLNPNTLLEVASTTSNAARIRVNNTSTTAGQYRGYEFASGTTFKGGFLQDQNTDLISIFTPIGGQSVNIKANGDVGIGTVNPASFANYRYLQITGSSTTQGGMLYLTTLDSSKTTELYVNSSGTTLSSGSANLNFYSGSASAMNMFTNGNVFIGPSSADSGYKLDVNGTGRFSGYLNANSQASATNGSVNIESADPTIRFRVTGGTTNKRIYELRAIAAGTTNDRMELRTWNDAQNAASSLLSITNSGTIGLNTTEPRSVFEISQALPFQTISSGLPSEQSTDNQALSGVNFYKHYGISYSAAIKMLQAGGPNNYCNAHLAFYTSDSGNPYIITPTERVRITASGNLGIGTQVPSGKLDVSGDVYFGKQDYSIQAIQRALVLRGDAVSGVYAGNSYRFYTKPGAFDSSQKLSIRAEYNGSETSDLFSINGSGVVSVSNNLLVKKESPSGFLSQWGVVSIGQSASLVGPPDANAILCANGFYDGSWRRVNTGVLNILEMTYGGSSVQFFTSPSGGAGSVASLISGPYIANGGVSWTNGSSDIRQKKNFEPSQGLEELLQIEAVKYHFNWDDDSSTKRLGFKAQNLKKLIPEMVSEQSKLADDGTPLLTITPDYLLPVLVKAIQEQQEIIKQLTNRIINLENK